ncbi:SusC/RagA family TonB-linked outer membrane protein [Aliifodinibius salicampi]|uniref:SusC/RagA family TonB-linked outer membrane protein n=1 Tax=Fodinibius salicampi TaxID=1920655 RepID=A0ABT3PWJ4_9BACT|nr:SusC/RagA family TonB-linked outer membrane protein [Fodinibius salicampi]MCW9712198.1 SusC/RagA family TonB-linked outer membrane protein [Fodinibius salicampi]
MTKNGIRSIHRLFSNGLYANNWLRYIKMSSRFMFSIGVAALFIIVSAFISTTHAQDTQNEVEVSGQVTEVETGETIPGVNIVVKGMASRGTSTDGDGNYTLTVPSPQDTLIFSFVGFVTQEVPVNGRSTINVELSSDVQALEDVVVVGYGTQDRQQVTGSISSVNSDDFISGDVSSPSELIEGKVPGLMVSSPGANPNEPPTLRLRGVSSFGNNEPLVVVDGIIGASMDNIDPNDIESIDVMKDASAAAIYGTRGGAGVIAITTKKGQSGTTSVSYNGSVSTSTVENKVDVLSADQFRELGEITDIAVSDLGASTDWFEEITQDNYTQIHNLSIQGGNETTSYRVSGNFRDNQGLLRTTGFQQRSGRLNLNHSALDDKLALTFDLSATNRDQDLGFNNAFQYAVTFNPTAPVKSEGFENTGGYTEIAAFDVYNPVAILETAENVRETRDISAALKADYSFDDLMPGLTASAFYSLQTYNGARNTFYARENKITGGATISSLGRGRAERETNKNTSEQFDLTLNYTTQASDDLNIEALAGYSYIKSESEGTFVGGGDFISDAVGFNNLSFAQDFDNGLGDISSYKNDNKLIAGFGRLNLNWDDTYFLNGTVRREGSTRFGVENKWGTFWSTGAGIELMNVVEVDFLDRLRLRGSYGVTGQDAPFDGISKLRFGPTGNFFVGGSFVQSFGPVSNPNPNLKWEETSEYNIGVDFGLLNERLSGTIEYYQKNTDDLILEIEVPVPPNLFPTSFLNVGEIESKGIEASLDYDVIRNSNYAWNTGATFSTFDITLKQFESDVPRYMANVGSPGQNNTQMVRVKEGEPLGQIWGPRFAEIGEDGIWRFLNADGELITSDEIAREDEAVIGNGVPDFEVGWTNSVNYKNWDFSVFLRGVYGHDLVNSARVFFENPTNISTYNVTTTAFDITELESDPAYSSYHVEDASYLRIQNVSLGYNVPLSEQSLIKRLRLSLSGRNLATFTGYQGIDPSVRWEDNGNPLAIGIERRDQWYTARSFTFGINIDF